MPNVLIGTGEKLNLLARGAVTVEAGTVNALFPASNLYDGRASRPCRFSSLDGIEEFQLDANETLNGSLDAWTAGNADDWTKSTIGTGTVTETTAVGEVVSGSAAKLTGGTLGVTLHQDLTVRAGEKRRIEVQIRGNGSGAFKFYIINMHTGRYLLSGGTWSATKTALFSETGASYVAKTLSYTLESYTRCGKNDLVTLRLMAEASASQIGYVDDCFDWPGADMLSVHGLVADDHTGVIWSTSTDASSWGDLASVNSGYTGFSEDQIPNLYIKRASTVQDKRYHKFEFDHNFLAGWIPANVLEIGEMVLSQVMTLSRNYDWHSELSLRQDNLSHEVGSEAHVYRKARWPSHVFGMQWQFVTDAQMRESRDDVFRRACGDALNVLLVPDDSANLVMLGRMNHAWAVQRAFTSHYTENQVSFAELPFASVAL